MNVYNLETIDSLRPINVAIEEVEYQGRKAIKVVLQREDFQDLVPASLQADGHQSLAMLPITFHNGTIELDMAGQEHLDQDPDSRGFVGVAFRSKSDALIYEAFYFRLTNGSNADPKPNDFRITKALQYVSVPEWDFHRFRAEAPGQYEKGANIAPATWFHVRIEIDGITAAVYVDNDPTPTLQINDLKLGADQTGEIGLWTGVASTGYFANVKVTHR